MPTLGVGFCVCVDVWMWDSCLCWIISTCYELLAHLCQGQVSNMLNMNDIIVTALPYHSDAHYGRLFTIMVY